MFSFLKKNKNHIITDHSINDISWRDRAIQYRKEADAAEETLSTVSRQKDELEQRSVLLIDAVKALASHIAGIKGNAQSLYEAAAPIFDPNGYYLFQQAQIIFGKFRYDAHFNDSWNGTFEPNSDTALAQYLFSDMRSLGDLEENVEERINQVYVNALVVADVISEAYYNVPSRKPLPLRCSDMFTDDQVFNLYWKWYRKLDPAGFELFQTAEELLGPFDEMQFPYEANSGLFECADGFKKLRYLTVQYEYTLGDQTIDHWSVVPGTCYEKCVSFDVDESTAEYRSFSAALYRNVCIKLGLLYERKDLERELTLRDQCTLGILAPEAKEPSGLDQYTNNQIGSALRGCRV